MSQQLAWLFSQHSCCPGKRQVLLTALRSQSLTSSIVVVSPEVLIFGGDILKFAGTEAAWQGGDEEGVGAAGAGL